MSHPLTHELVKRVSKKYEDSRKSCLLCFEYLSSLLGATEAREKAKKVVTYCKDCPKNPSMCMHCFENHLWNTNQRVKQSHLVAGQREPSFTYWWTLDFMLLILLSLFFAQCSHSPAKVARTSCFLVWFYFKRFEPT